MPLSQEDKEHGLWRCDCEDENTHTNIDYHDDTCSYAIWLIEMSTSDYDLDD